MKGYKELENKMVGMMPKPATPSLPSQAPVLGASLPSKKPTPLKMGVGMGKGQGLVNRAKPKLKMGIGMGKGQGLVKRAK